MDREWGCVEVGWVKGMGLIMAVLNGRSCMQVGSDKVAGCSSCHNNMHNMLNDLLQA